MASDPAPRPPAERIVIAGAGSVGCFAGGLLAAAGRDVVLLGRPRVLDAIATAGLHLTDLSGLDARIAPARLGLTDDPAALARADLVLVTVKTGATAGMAALIATHAPPGAPVVSLQNGRAAAAALRDALPGRDVRPGMVPFNVVPAGPGHYHRATSGDILIGTGPRALAALLSVPHLPVAETPEIEAVQWGKLLMNLANALNALSGLTLREMLLDRDWRRLMADQMNEALAVLQAAGIRPRAAAPVPVWLIPRLLRLPTALFRRIAGRMIAIDARARTSMAYDLDAGRETEVGALQGEIVRLGEAQGMRTAINARVMQAVAAAAPGTTLSPDDLRR